MADQTTVPSDADATRVRLLDAAIADAAERGLEGISPETVAELLGVDVAEVTAHLDSTDALVRAIITRIADDVVSWVEPLVVDAMQGVVDVDGFADQIIPLLASTPHQQLRVQFEAYTATHRRPDLVPSVRAIISTLEQAASLALASLGVPNPTVVGRQFLAVIDGFALQEVAWSRPDHLPAMTAALRRLLDSYLADAT